MSFQLWLARLRAFFLNRSTQLLGRLTRNYLGERRLPHKVKLRELEDRVLMSAAPVGAEVPISPELAEVQETTAAAGSALVSEESSQVVAALSPSKTDALDLSEKRDAIASALATDSQLVSHESLPHNTMAGDRMESVASVQQELVFVDTRTENYQLLVDDIQAELPTDRSISFVFLDSDRGGIEQITEALSGYERLDAIHLVSHGNDQGVQLGGTWLDLSELRAHAGEIAGWSEFLSADADVLIYGCNLAASDEGQELVNTLGSLTGADVAASNDLTGSSQLSGDWDLEYRFGVIDAAVIAGERAQENWLHTLNMSVDASPTAANLVDIVSSADNDSVTVDTASIALSAGASTTGSFQNNDSNIGIDSGIVLSTGTIAGLPQAPATQDSQTIAGNDADDVDLDAINPGTQSDVVALEFDFDANVSKIAVRFVFASEEFGYQPGSATTGFDDTFGVFVSGAEPRRRFLRRSEHCPAANGRLHLSKYRKFSDEFRLYHGQSRQPKPSHGDGRNC